MRIVKVATKGILLIALLAMMCMPASAADKLQTGASKGDAKKHRKSFSTPCTGNCADNSTRNLKNR
jgi:hypothetical protein